MTFYGFLTFDNKQTQTKEAVFVGVFMISISHNTGQIDVHQLYYCKTTRRLADEINVTYRNWICLDVHYGFPMKKKHFALWVLDLSSSHTSEVAFSLSVACISNMINIA